MLNPSINERSDLADKRENKLLILTVWSSVDTITRIIAERVDVAKLILYLSLNKAIFEPLTEFECYKAFIKHVCTILLRELYRL